MRFGNCLSAAFHLENLSFVLLANMKVHKIEGMQTLSTRFFIEIEYNALDVVIVKSPSADVCLKVNDTVVSEPIEKFDDSDNSLRLSVLFLCMRHRYESSFCENATTLQANAENMENPFENKPFLVNSNLLYSIEVSKNMQFQRLSAIAKMR